MLTRDDHATIESIARAITTPPPGSRGTIDLPLALGVRQLANSLGEKEAARRLQISPVTLARVAGAFPIQGMTLDILRQRLAAQVDAAGQVSR